MSLALAELHAHRKLIEAEPGDDIIAAHAAWLEARRAIEARIRETGAIVEHLGPDDYTAYSLGYTNTLHKRTIHHGRYR